MKRICTYCLVISDDLNLWCQEKHCPAEKASEIFDNGEWLGPIQIIEPLVVLRSSIIYRARREDVPVLLKVANAGCEDKLRREAQAFLQLAQTGQHPVLPVLLPAQPQGTVGEFPFGWTVINGKSRYFSVFAELEGEILRSYLLKNPQPYYLHAGWITLSIADAVFYMHQKRSLHLCMSPDIILVRFDGKGIPRPILLDLGIGEDRQDARAIWNASFNLPAYTPPEIFTSRERIDWTSDVYGMGLLLYEMLAGRPAFPYQLKNDQVVTNEILAGRPLPTRRTDLKGLPNLAERSISRRGEDRPRTIAEFAQELRKNLPPIPPEKKKFQMNWKLFFIIVGAAMIVSLLALIALVITK
jgi:serine/threonine protein kinase